VAKFNVLNLKRRSAVNHRRATWLNSGSTRSDYTTRSGGIHMKHADEYQFQANTPVNWQQLDHSMILLVTVEW